MKVADTVSAPSLLKMHSPRARVVAAAIVAAAAFSVLSDRRNVEHLSLLILALVVLAIGTAGLLWDQTDPMAWPAAVWVATSGPIAVLLTCLAIPGPLSNPNQANALGVAVALCAFLCVRGRVVTAWVAMGAIIAIFAVWGTLTGQGTLVGLVLAVPNVAVLLMATGFALIVRPAARGIQQLHDRAVQESETIAETGARIDERDRQRERLQHLAGPTVELIAQDEVLTDAQIVDAVLTEALLRDSMRTKILDAPELLAAARDARGRGVIVAMRDDHAMDSAAPDTVAAFLQQATRWLSSTVEGKVRVWVHPPGSRWLATVVVVKPDETERHLYLNTDGTFATL